MSDSTTIGNSAPAVLSALFAASLAVWSLVGIRLTKRRPPLERVPREGVAWPSLPVFATFLIAFLVHPLIVSQGDVRGQLSRTTVQWHCAGLIAQIVAVVGLLTLAAPVRAADFGWRPATWRKDLLIGAAGYLASLVPVLGINLFVDRLGLRSHGEKHLFFKILNEDLGDGTLAWIAFSVIVLAPLAEELLYRVLLQGWSQSEMAPWKAILFSATIFAVVHSWPDNFAIFALGLLLGYVYYRRQSYLAVVVVHSLFNATTLTFSVLLSPQ